MLGKIQACHLSVPTGLQAAATAYNKVELRWFASTDTGGSGISGYRLYRGGQLIGPNPITTPSYTDTTVSAATSYVYSVKAVDGAGNASADSSTVNVTTPFELLFEDDFNRLDCFNNGQQSYPCVLGPWSEEQRFALSGHGARCAFYEVEGDPDATEPCELTKTLSPSGNVRIVVCNAVN